MVRAVLAALLAASVQAAGSGAAFLKIPVSAQSLATGGGYVAGASGVSALGINPAGLSGLASKEATVLYAPHLADMNLGYMAYGHPSQLGMFGLSFLRLASGALEGRDEQGNATGDFTAEDSALAVTFGRDLARSFERPTGRVRVGASLKHIRSRIGSFSAQTFAADLGTQVPLEYRGVPLAVGLSVRNVGPGLKFLERADPLPLNAALGVMAKPWGAVAISAGLTRHMAEERTEFSVGTELAGPAGMLLRGNYGMVRRSGAVAENIPSLSGGFGLKVGMLQMDYAFMPMGALGATQRVSLTFRFGSFEPEVPNRRFGKNAYERKRSNRNSAHESNYWFVQ
jgi:hypothetical protein